MGEKFEVGGREQFMLTTSVALDANPLFFIRNFAGTLVYSSQASNSGDGYYYEFADIPSSKGDYTYNWYYTISANTFVEAGRFEAVQTLVAETAGLYCQATDVINLYDPLRSSKLRNHEIDEFIRGIMAEVNTKLGHVFSVNSLAGNPTIHLITSNLALVSILERKGKEVPQWVTDRKTKFEGILDGIAAGSMFLATSDGSMFVPAVSTDVAKSDHSMANYTPTFNMLGADLQRVDPDRLEDEEDAL